MRAIKCIIILLVLTGLVGGSSAQSSRSPLFSFGVVADVQYADIPDKGTRHYRRSPEKLSQAVEVFNRENVSFVLSLGDFINDHIEGFDTLNSITSKLTMPLYHVTGNHDYDPERSGRKETLRRMNLKRSDYSFAREGWRFIITDGNDISLYGNRNGSAKYKEAEKRLEAVRIAGLPQAQSWNGAIGPRQLARLDRRLARSGRKGEKVIIACHFPLQTSKPAERLWNEAGVNLLLRKHPHVYAWFAGHGHISQHIFADNIHHLMFRGMVEGIDNAFAIVRVYPGHLETEGYGLEVSRNTGNE